MKKFFKPGENPIGQHFGEPGMKSPGDYEIVGVVEDTAYQSVRWKDHTMYFLPLMQRAAERQGSDRERYVAVRRGDRYRRRRTR